MSAARQKPGGAIPPHIITFEGRLVNNELMPYDLECLRVQSRNGGFNLEAECQKRYGYGSDWLNYEQWREMFNAIRSHLEAKQAHKPKHSHRCYDCGRVTVCYTERCKDEDEDECRDCHENTGWLINRRPSF